MKRLGDDARRVLEAAGAPGMSELTVVVAAWPGCVGETISRAAWPRRLARDGTLHVATVSSTWAFELGRLEREITGRLEEVLGEQSPTSLRFAPGHVPEPAAAGDEQAFEESLEITRESRLEAERLASGIESGDLRDLVARAAAASLERGRSDRHFC